MRPDSRLFDCGFCGTCVRICKHCDRGQRYCSRECAYLARRRSAREAERRYRASDAGRRGNARRQRDHYRRRRANEEDLTHQGSDASGVLVFMVAEKDVEALHSPVAVPEESTESTAVFQESPFCDFCGRECTSKPRSHGGP